MNPASPPAPEGGRGAGPTFDEALKFWLKLGFVSFGGPAGQVAAAGSAGLVVDTVGQVRADFADRETFQDEIEADDTDRAYLPKTPNGWACATGRKPARRSS